MILGIRPEDFEDASLAAGRAGRPADARSTCDLTEPLGAEVLVHFGTAATGVVSSAADATPARTRTSARGGGDDEATARACVARVSPRTRSPSGRPIELAVDTSRLYFFDPRDAANAAIGSDSP